MSSHARKTKALLDTASDRLSLGSGVGGHRGQGGRTRRLRPAVRRVAIALVVLLTALALTGVAYQAVATTVDRDAYPAPGQLVDVGGYRLHVDVRGTDSGASTVVLDEGAASAAAQWGWVQRELAPSTRVVAYDRPGLGYSDPAPAGLDAAGLARDLRTALHRLGVEGPYLLVGHSMGALTTRVFAQRYPGETAGMVLVDPRRGPLEQDWPEVGPLRETTPVELRAAPAAARLGLLRLLDPLGNAVDRLPADAAGQARAVLASPQQWSGTFPDARLGETAARALTRGGPERYRDLPLHILSADQPDASIGDAADRAWFTGLHREMLELSTRARHTVIPGADHLSIVTHPDHARRVAQVIRELLQQTPAPPPGTG